MSAIAFGFSASVQSSQARAKAKGELAVIAQALEQFKIQNGDYPWVSGDPADAGNNAKILFQSLLGWQQFVRVDGSIRFEAKDSNEVSSQLGAEPLLDIDQLRYADLEDSENFNPDLGNAISTPGDFVILDPWGHPYVYLYGQSSAGTWEVFGYHLYSKGPDGLDDNIGLSVVTGSTDELTFRGQENNLDNIYVGE